MALHTYVSRDAPSLRIDTSHGFVRFQDKTLKLDDEDELQAKKAKELDEALMRNPSISAVISKVDLAEAERIAQEYLASQTDEAQAMSGPITAAGMKAQERLGPVLPAELRGASGTGMGSDGITQEELHSMMVSGALSPNGV